MIRPLFEYPDDEEGYAANMGFAPMLAEEYLLIVSFAYQLQPGLDLS